MKLDKDGFDKDGCRQLPNGEVEIRLGNMSDEDFLAIAKEAYKHDITINHQMERMIVSGLLKDKAMKPVKRKKR